MLVGGEGRGLLLPLWVLPHLWDQLNTDGTGRQLHWAKAVCTSSEAEENLVWTWLGPVGKLTCKWYIVKAWRTLEAVLSPFTEIKQHPADLYGCVCIFYFFLVSFCYLTLSSLNGHTNVGAEFFFSFFLLFCFVFLGNFFLHFLVAHTETGWHKNWPIRNSLQQVRLQVNGCQGSHSKQKIIIQIPSWDKKKGSI